MRFDAQKRSKIHIFQFETTLLQLQHQLLETIIQTVICQLFEQRQRQLEQSDSWSGSDNVRKSWLKSSSKRIIWANKKWFAIEFSPSFSLNRKFRLVMKFQIAQIWNRARNSKPMLERCISRADIFEALLTFVTAIKNEWLRKSSKIPTRDMWQW